MSTPTRQRGWSTPVVCGVALLSAGVGFATRGLLPAQAPLEAPAVVAPPAPRVEVEPPVAEDSALPVVVAALPSKPAPSPEPAAAPVVAAPEAPPAAAPEKPAAPALERIELPYEHLEGLAQRIIIPVVLNGRVTARMALDTGAPGTILSTRLATKLGLMEEGASRLRTAAGGIGGSAPASLVILDSLAVGRAKSEFVPATVTELFSDAWDGLVGMDFLAGYSVNIDSAEHVLVLTEQSPRASTPAGHDEAWWRRTFQLLAGQRAWWKNVRATLEEKISKSEVSAGGDAETMQKLLVFARSQDREAEQLASRLERHASTHSVPLEWRRNP